MNRVFTNGQTPRLSAGTGGDQKPPAADPPVAKPAYDLDAERAVLGSMLRDNAVIVDLAQIVGPTDFYPDRHQRLFRCFLDLHLAGAPVDLVTSADAMKRSGSLEDAGGYSTLGELWEAAPTAANADYYARIVRDHSLLRNLAYAASEILREAREPTGPAREVLEAAERKVFALAEAGQVGDAVPIVVALDACLDHYDAVSTGVGVPTGLASLDSILVGLQEGELTILAARPSVGKTSLGLQIALHAAIDSGLPAFFVSLEQSRRELGQRILSSRTGIDGNLIRKRRLTPDDVIFLSQARNALLGSPLTIDDSPDQGMLRIASQARRQKHKDGLALVVIDYLQLIEAEDRRAPRQEQVAAITRRLKLLAREISCPVVALAQLNRNSEERSDGKPKLSDLRESGAVEQDADVVLLMHKLAGDEQSPVATVCVQVAKQRNGPTGEIHLAYRKACTRFELLARREDLPA